MSEYKNQRNKRIQRRYDDLAEQGRHGHYETLFKVISEEVDTFAVFLRDIYLADKDYAEINNLGDPHQNQRMKNARNLLIESGYINEEIIEKEINPIYKMKVQAIIDIIVNKAIKSEIQLDASIDLALSAIDRNLKKV